MTEQVVFTNGTNSVGRICVSLLPLSTGCQQFSVSPAVLELGPKASSAFHVTFNARYAGAVSGIFQFRGSVSSRYSIPMKLSLKPVCDGRRSWRHRGMQPPLSRGRRPILRNVSRSCKPAPLGIKWKLAPHSFGLTEFETKAAKW